MCGVAVEIVDNGSRLLHCRRIAERGELIIPRANFNVETLLN